MPRASFLGLFDRYGAEILARQRQTELEPVPEAFHQMRVYVKRARALLELVDAIAPRFPRKRSMRVFRDAFRATGKVRDLHVQIGIAHSVAARLGANVNPYATLLEMQERNAVGTWIASGSRVSSEALSGVREAMADALARRQWVSLASSAWTHFNARFRDVLEFDAHAADLHDLRKRVKECSNLTWIIAEVAPELTIGEPLSNALDRLQKQLGDWHDYDVAVQTAGIVPTTASDAPVPERWVEFLDSLEAERSRLRDKVLRNWTRLAKFAPPGI